MISIPQVRRERETGTQPTTRAHERSSIALSIQPKHIDATKTFHAIKIIIMHMKLCLLKQWWPSSSSSDIAADVLHPTPPFFFPEITVWWKHCAFSVFLLIRIHPLHQLALESCHSHTSHSNQRQLIQQCLHESIWWKCIPEACTVPVPWGNLREAFSWRICLCSEPVTHKMHNLS